jgi:ribosome-associated translation inhibitor RaiA
MQVDVRRQGLEVGEEARQRLDRRLDFARGRFERRIAKVTVYLAELNGPRGGVDKSCRIVVRVRRSGEVVVEDRDADLYVLIDRAANRVGQAVLSEFGRRRARRNRPPES